MLMLIGFVDWIAVLEIPVGPPLRKGEDSGSTLL